MINSDLRKYIEENILPIYSKNDDGHGIEHINSVVERSLKLISKFDNLNVDMVYTIACFHDIAHHIDKDKHEILSARMFYEDKWMENYFSLEDRAIIKEAIEDHRASLDGVPRSDYGKLVSSADRNIDIESFFKRTHSYTLRHFPSYNLDEMINRAFHHLNKKFGDMGYAKIWCFDDEYEEYKKKVKQMLSDKYLFSIKYMEINDVFDIKEKAKLFALKAHMGQVRKSEVDKPMIMHPFSVAKILEEYGFDDNVVAAGYLHDVVEDTKYTILDIEKEFGSDIASLVMSASEEDKSLSWEERKKHTILTTKDLPLRNKAVICADKISNLEDLNILFEKNGKRDFSSFKRGEESQKWYYSGVYESLIFNEDASLPMFKRLKDVLDKVFYGSENLFLKNEVFFGNTSYYEKLKKLHAQKAELQKLKSLCLPNKPFVIEFSGTPRTGKTTTINNLYDFFKKGGFNVSIVEEFTTSSYFKKEIKPLQKELSSYEYHVLIIEEVYRQLMDYINNNDDIILVDRSINDRQIWNYIQYKKGNMNAKEYNDLKEKYMKLSKEFINYLVVTYAESIVSLRRDYVLALEDRSFLNIPNLDMYNKALSEVKNVLEESVGGMSLLDTTNLSLNDITCDITSSILPSIRSEYIKTFVKKYDIDNRH